MKKLSKEEVVAVPVPAGSPVGQLIEISNYKPDRDYKFVVGVNITIDNPNADPGAAARSLLAGFRDSTAGTVLDDAPVSRLLASENVEPNKKFRDLYIKCDGRSLKPRVTPTFAVADDYTVYFTFMLVDELVEVAQR